MTQSIPQTLPESRKAMILALAHIRWKTFGECRTVGYDGPPPTAAEADAALVAALSRPMGVAGIPPGMALVPIEPTEEMCNAEALDVGKKTARNTWAAMVAAAPQPPAGQQDIGWQPIETAPKDGRTMLLGCFNSHNKWRTMRGQWMSEVYIGENWEDPDDALAGWYETVVEGDDIPNCWYITPTHWMPLPTAPSIGPSTQGVDHG